MIPSDTRGEAGAPSGANLSAWEAGEAHLATVQLQPLHGVGVPRPEGVTNEEGYFAQEAYKRATGSQSVLGVGINAALGAAAAVRRAIAPPPAGGDVAGLVDDFADTAGAHALLAVRAAISPRHEGDAAEAAADVKVARADLLAARADLLAAFAALTTQIATLKRETERLRAEAAGWQDISTAPKDGRLIRVARHMGAWGWIVGTARWYGRPGVLLSGWISRGTGGPGDGLGLADPSHWASFDPPRHLATTDSTETGEAER